MSHLLLDRRIRTDGFERLEIDVNGTKIVVYAAGNGAPLVYFHGASTFHGFEFARNWTNNFRVYLPYHPGFGESPYSKEFTSTADYINHYNNLFKTLDLDTLNLAGCSLGGRLAAEFALTFPERLSSLTLICPAGLHCREFPMADLSNIAPEDIPNHLVKDLNVLTPYLPIEYDEDFVSKRDWENFTIGTILEGGSFESPLINSKLSTLRTRTLIVWGDNDNLIPVQQAYRWQRKITNAQLKIIENVGHLVLDESIEARDIIRDFLKG
ncbi:MAG: alpha/beta fold hydrolase [Pseudomonas rhizophila]|uniref:alpha/beta fold hydrolase n=1 Tax=Pseudomonas rhizophila TaxID=2045200 RepID=UPI003F6CD60F